MCSDRTVQASPGPRCLTSSLDNTLDRLATHAAKALLETMQLSCLAWHVSELAHKASKAPLRTAAKLAARQPMPAGLGHMWAM